MQILNARIIFSLAAGQGHFRRSVSIHCSAVEKSNESNNLQSWNDIPGPPSLPCLGVIHNFFPGGKLAGYKGGKLTDRLYELYGPIVKFNPYLGGHRQVFFFDPQAVENVLRREEPLPVRPTLESLEYYLKRHNKIYDPNRTTGVGTDHGKVWKNSRSKVNPIMMLPKTIQLYADVLDAVSNDMIARLRSVRCANNKITRLDVLVNQWSLESLAAVALGIRLNCFDPDLTKDSPVSQLIENIHGFFQVAQKLDASPSAWKIYSTPTFKKAIKIYENIDRLTHYFIDEVAKTYKGVQKEAGGTSKTEKSVIEKLSEIDDRLVFTMTTEILRGGIDTVSNTVMGTLYLLAKNPEIQNKLRKEILEKQKQKHYLRACISEAMRMLPAGVANLRLTTKEHNILGYKIPTNVQIIFCLQSMSNMEKYFPMSDQYIPERWLVGRDDPLCGKSQLFATIPFGFGVRMCIGRRIVELEMEILLSKIIKNFQVEWPTEEPIQIDSGLINQVREPLHFTFRDL